MQESVHLNQNEFGKFDCPAFKELVVLNRGFGLFSFKKDEIKGILKCPLCKSGKKLKIRNCGFVNGEWQMRGIMKKNKESKIYAEGRTYDGKLYTFKECDYSFVWDELEVLAKKLDGSSVQNI